MNLVDFLIAVLTMKMWHSPMFLFILLLLLSIKAALLSLSVFGDHELGVFMTIGDPGNGAGGQAGKGNPMARPTIAFSHSQQVCR